MTEEPGLGLLLLFKLEVDAFLITSFHYSSSILGLVVSMLCDKGVLTAAFHLLLIGSIPIRESGVLVFTFLDGDLGFDNGVLGLFVLHSTDEPGLLLFILLLKLKVDAFLITGFHHSSSILGLVISMLCDESVLAPTLHLLLIITFSIGVGCVLMFTFLNHDLGFDDGVLRVLVLDITEEPCFIPTPVSSAAGLDDNSS